MDCRQCNGYISTPLEHVCIKKLGLFLGRKGEMPKPPKQCPKGRGHVVKSSGSSKRRD